MTYHAPPVLGIDLGTTNTVVAAFAGDNIQLIYNHEASPLFPSVVAFAPNGELLVGGDAKLRRVIDPQNTIFSSKRLIGRSFRDPTCQDVIQMLPYRIIEGNRQEPMIRTRAGLHTLPQIASFILTHVVRYAEAQMGISFRQCVITVPANFTDSQRAATHYAAEQAGLEVLRILNEPTAAAVAYGQITSREQRIAIFDMGGGTFDLTVLATRQGLSEVIATGGDPFLGGDDMDKALADHLALAFLESERIDLATIPESYSRLLLIAEDIKQRLTDSVLVEDTIREIAYGVGGRPLDLSFRLRRERFEHLITHLVDRSLDCAAGVLRDAGIMPGQLDALVLVGGATRVPLVRRRLEERFGLKPRVELNPLEVVARGAATQAVRLVSPSSEDAESTLLVDVTSHALGISTTAGFVEHLILQNTPIPAEGREVFSTSKDGQTTVRVRVSQGSSRHYVDNVAVGELVLEGLRSAPRGEVKVEVAFLIDANGLLSVSAQDLESGRRESATLNLLGVNLGDRGPNQENAIPEVELLQPFSAGEQRGLPE